MRPKQRSGDSRVQSDLFQGHDFVRCVAPGFVHDSIRAFADLLDPREGIINHSCRQSGVEWRDSGLKGRTVHAVTQRKEFPALFLTTMTPSLTPA